MLRALAHLGSLRARASRTEFAWVFFGSVGLSFLILPIYLAPVPAPLQLIAIIPSWVSFYALIAVSVRRLHDLGKTGWLLLLWPVPIVGIIFLVWFLARPAPYSMADRS